MLIETSTTLFVLLFIAIGSKAFWFDMAAQLHRQRPLVYIHPKMYPWWYLGPTTYRSRK
jgi:hypothetical protein